MTLDMLKARYRRMLILLSAIGSAGGFAYGHWLAAAIGFAEARWIWIGILFGFEFALAAAGGYAIGYEAGR